MRHTIVTCGVLVLLTSGLAQAGTVHFNPPSATITPGTQSVSFDVSVSWETLPTIDTLYVLVWGDYGANLNFAFAQSFLDSTLFPVPPPDEQLLPCGFSGICPEQIGFGGNNFNPGWASPLLIGTLTVTTSALQAGDVDRIRVDPTEESELFGDPAIYVSLLGSGLMYEPLRGTVTITVVPEPATALILLILGGIGLASRRGVDP